jgi:hypothetical protein
VDGAIHSPRSLHQKLELARLSDPNLEHEPTIGLEEFRRFSQYSLVNGQSVWTTVECFTWLARQQIRSFCVEACGRDVRRITANQIHGSFELLPVECLE